MWVVGQNLDKEAKFDLMTGQGKKRSLEAWGLHSLTLKKGFASIVPWVVNFQKILSQKTICIV